MTSLFRTMTMSAVALGIAGITMEAQPQPARSHALDDRSPVTVRGCLERESAPQPVHGEPQLPRGNPPATQATTTHPGQPGSVHGDAAAHARQTAGEQFILRVDSPGISGATPRTGMPTAEGGLVDERLAAGAIGTTVYRLKAGPSVDLAAHVQHTVEVTGHPIATVGQEGTGAGAPGTASPVQSPSQAGTSGAASATTGAMPTTASVIEAGWLEVTTIRMIADTCS
jgi:hypothetical protein